MLKSRQNLQPPKPACPSTSPKALPAASTVQPLSPMRKPCRAMARSPRLPMTTRDVARGPPVRRNSTKGASETRRTGSSHQRWPPNTRRRAGQWSTSRSRLSHVKVQNPSATPYQGRRRMPASPKRLMHSTCLACLLAIVHRPSLAVRRHRLRYRLAQSCYFAPISWSQRLRSRLRSSDEPYLAKSYWMSLMSAIFGACSGTGAFLLEGFW